MALTPKILSQRFAQANKKIMAQSEVIFHPASDEWTMTSTRCMEYVKKSVATDRRDCACLQPGQGVYIGTDGTQLVTPL